MRLFLFIGCFYLGLLSGTLVAGEGGGGVPPTPKVLDCTFVNGICTQPTQDCTVMGGTCQANGSGSRWHDGESGPADSCGCLV